MSRDGMSGNVDNITEILSSITLRAFLLWYWFLLVCLSVFVCTFWNFRCKQKVLLLKTMKSYYKK